MCAWMIYILGLAHTWIGQSTNELKILKSAKSWASDAAPDALLGASDGGRTSRDCAALQPLWNRASDALTSSHQTLVEHYSCIRWNSDIGSLAKLCMHQTLECPMTCRRMRPVRQNRLWTLTGPHRTLSVECRRRAHLVATGLTVELWTSRDTWRLQEHRTLLGASDAWASERPVPP
jgi:hypothetical protein